MRITKLDPYNIDDQKTKNRGSSSSHDKGLSILARKKLQLANTDNQNWQRNTNEGHGNEQRETVGGNEIGEGSGNGNGNGEGNGFMMGGSKKEVGGKEQKEFMDFLENQMKGEIKEMSQTAKNKVKLPQIGTNKQLNTNTLIEDDLQLQPEVQKATLNKNTAMQKSTQKQNPIFINIKSVIPMEKSAINKKKDHSLRDLRILRKERQSTNVSNNDDYIVEKGQGENNQRNKVGMVKKSYISKVSERQSPNTLKLSTAEKRRSQRSSLQKLSCGVNGRERRAFSINQGKKKYATTYQQFCLFISSLNKIRLSQAPVVLYKAFVGKGNNSILIKNVIKNRFWWNIVAEKTSGQEVNFVWSQQRDNQFIAELGCTKVDNKQVQSVEMAKRQKYHLQAKEEKEQPVTRDSTRYGFSRLLSQKESREQNFTPLYAETISLQSLSEPIDAQKLRIHNHFQSNWNLTNKKALFYNLKTYYELIKEDPFKYIPLTYHVKEPGDKSWDEFSFVYNERVQERLGDVETKEKKKKKETKKEKPTLPLWIIKPGENTNQGCGIQVSDSLEQIEQIVKEKTENGKNRSSIIQRYLMPFLYNKRKFDIRCYVLTTSIKGIVKGYWYEEGYIRTSSKQFTTKNLKNRMIHLTNDAVQKKSEDYGKYENGNKISFADFQKYLDNSSQDKKLNFYKTVYPKMMRLARDALTATYLVLDGKNREFTFEVFGLDFMIDEEFETWLIQVNNNPCLELSSPLLARIIPNMIENAMKIAIDPMFPPPLNIPKSKNLPTDLFEANKFTLIFNSCDVEEGFLKGITENKVNLDKIVEGKDEDDELMDDEDEGEDVAAKEKVEIEQTFIKTKEEHESRKEGATKEESQRETDTAQSLEA